MRKSLSKRVAHDENNAAGGKKNLSKWNDVVRDSICYLSF